MLKSLSLWIGMQVDQVQLRTWFRFVVADSNSDSEPARWFRFQFQNLLHGFGFGSDRKGGHGCGEEEEEGREEPNPN